MLEAVQDHPEAYFLTWRTYGTWLHGDARGSYQRVRGTPRYEAPDAGLHRASEVALGHRPVVFTPAMRAVVDATFRQVCTERDWDLFAVNVRTNHVHLAVALDIDPDRAAGQLKAWATRRLREAKLVRSNRPVWAMGASTRYLWTDAQVERAVAYVLYGQ